MKFGVTERLGSTAGSLGAVGGAFWPPRPDNEACTDAISSGRLAAGRGFAHVGGDNIRR